MNEIVKFLKKERKNEWVSGIVPGLLFHMCLSIVYCWSLVKVDIDSYVVGNTSWAFSIMVFTLAITAIFSLDYIERHTKDAARYGAVLFSLGMIGSGLSCQLNSLIGLYVFFGGCLGVGAGLIYQVPLKIISKWFKEKKKGFLGKLFVLLSTISSFIMVPSVKNMVEEHGIVPTFTIFGIICLIILMIASWLIEAPETEKREYNKSVDRWIKFKRVIKDFHELPGIVTLWIILFINLSCGLALISCERDIMLVSGFPVVMGMAFARIAMPIGKGFFRPLIKNTNKGSIYKAWEVIFVLNILAVLISLITRSGMWFSVILINLGYGASFVLQPSLITDLYGKRKMARVYGLLLTAWACAGLFGNQIAEEVYRNGEGPGMMMIILGLMSLIGLILTVSFKWIYKFASKR